MAYMSDHFRQKWNFDKRRNEFATALENTPEPDESEAVKLLRELVDAAEIYKSDARFWPLFDRKTAAAVKFLSNTIREEAGA
jgi:nitrate reductase assembly molybdenum cofactor insertion protein NarJ